MPETTKTTKPTKPATTAVQTAEPGAPTTSSMLRHLLDWPTRVHWADLFDDVDGPRLDLEEFDQDGTHVVRAEMPGIDPDRDVHVSVDHGMLTIRAERREESHTDDREGYRSEFRYGAFARSVRLPAGATGDDVKATYTDGILEIRFPVDHQRAAAQEVLVTRG